MIRVVGLGSPFGDDRVGWHLVELLQRRATPNLEAVALDRPGAGLLNWFIPEDHVVIVDALLSDGRVGQICAIDPAQLESANSALSSHQLDLGAIVRLAGALDCRPAGLDVYAISVGTLDGFDMSPAVVTAATELAVRLLDLACRSDRGRCSERANERSVPPL